MKVLDKVWVNGLKMWKWISENLPDGFSEASKDIKDFIIDHLKQNWLQKNRFTKKIRNDCFFCEYDGKRKKQCISCPAKLASPEDDFDCITSDYNYAYEPRLFYNKILELNAKRERG